jgi:hypothetical protein
LTASVHVVHPRVAGDSHPATGPIDLADDVVVAEPSFELLVEGQRAGQRARKAHRERRSIG